MGGSPVQEARFTEATGSTSGGPAPTLAWSRPRLWRMTQLLPARAADDPYILKPETLSKPEPRVVLRIDPCSRRDPAQRSARARGPQRPRTSSSSPTRRTSGSRLSRTKRSRRSSPASGYRRSATEIEERVSPAARLAPGGARSARREGADRLLRAAGHRQDIRRARARRGDHARRRRLPDRPVPPSYSYEDFVGGFRPVEDDGAHGVRYQRTNGPLREMAAAARGRPRTPVRPDRRRDQPRQHPEDLRRAPVPARVPPEGRSPPVLARGAVQPAAEPLLDRHDEHGRPVDRAGRCRASPPLLLRPVHSARRRRCRPSSPSG